ncbi:ATP-binding protein [Paramicrobacterium agarici]|uniref:Phage shock protein C (PspC) family protein n=1 Tax=Paramicrobacterium agarici TaxID=630514 RepID=A0A2A9DVU8_9MICO|nr:PspC domain-containing protein [Microbacterium agarici]PFG30265.1 phage shock protein C (PspC) family protein [Microbacterium agarici]TQO23272.1 phage shock protein C (PspC) family protein [Microbacterium agarici]
MHTATIVRPRLRVIGGVCAGVAGHIGVPVSIVRLVTAILTVCGGAGLLLYAWLWATTPVSEGSDSVKSVLTRPTTAEETTDAVPERAPITEILLGIALLLAGGAMIASRLGANIPLAFIIPAVVVLAGAGLAWRQFDELRRGRVAGRSALVVRAMGALVLVVLGILLFFVTGDEPNIWTVFFAASAVLLGVAVVVAPWVIRLARDLADERAARARDVERAEVAAHLHDSVLQTLALIQQKADPGSDASRLARAQERELRQWLFAETVGGPLDLSAELRRAASALENDFSARIEVITTGIAVPEAPEGLLAAAREAMLNAAQHAGGTVTVYSESSPSTIEISISDRGPGFDVDAIPDNHFGVRESIVGRMKRIGGDATIRRGPGGTGTEVLLSMSHAQPTKEEM